MMKFTMDAKELKTMLEKGIAAINKKAALSCLTRIYLQVEVDGTLKALGTDTEHYAEIRSNSAYNTSPGVLGIDIDDMKVISKMSGEITLEDVSTENESKINLKCGKKVVSIPRYYNVDTFLPNMDDTEEHILTLKESWLLETITNLFAFTADEWNPNKMLTVFHFNTVDKRVEALDLHRIGMRTLEDQQVIREAKTPFENVLLLNKCMPVFKKIMDKKSDAEVKVYQDKKYVRIEGENFTYVTRRVDGEYFKVNRLLTDDRDYTFTSDRKNMLDVLKYICDLKNDPVKPKPVVLHGEDGKLYTYIKTMRYEVLDQVEADDIKMDGELYVGFNPQYLLDIFNIVDTDNPLCRGRNSNKYPLFVDGNEYSFMVLPVHLEVEDAIKMKDQIDKDRVA